MWLSILGMYNNDNTLFDGLNTPEGITKDDVVDNILIECSELEVVYPEPAILKRAIEIWSNSNQIEWNKLYNTMTVEYNPIWNVDADIKDVETITGDKISDRTIGTTGKDTRTLNLTDKDTRNLTDTKSVQGFNSASWASAEKLDQTGTDTITHTGTDTLNRTENVSDNVTDKDNSTREYTQRRTGNIGVTATQDLIQKEREVAVFNMIEYITESFKERFCIMVY